MRPALLAQRLSQLRSPATQDTALLYLSHMVGAGTGFIVALIVARELGPTEFAVVAAYMLIVDTVTGFTDFGLGTAMIRFTSPLLKTAREKAFPYFRAALYAEIAAGILVLLVGLSLSGAIEGFVGDDLPGDVVTLAIIAAAVTSTAAYVAAAQAAHKLFKRSAALAIGVGVTRLAAVLGLLATSELSLYNVIYAYAVVSFIAAAAGFAITPRDYLHPVEAGTVRKAGVEILRFSGWLTLTYFITSVMGRLDFFYLYRIEGAGEAGVYAAAVQLSLAVTILIGTISTVVTPYISERTTYASQVDFLRQSLPLVAGIAIVLVATSVTYPFVIELLFGAQYADAATPLTVLVIHLALNVVLIPISLMYMPLGKVRVGTFISVAQLALALVLYPILIEAHGAVGAALTVLATTVLALIASSVILRYYMLRERDAEIAAAAQEP